MRAIVYSTEAEALAMRDALDALAGCPSPDGLTEHYSYVVAHPDGTQWALYVDDTVDGLLPVIADQAAPVDGGGDVVAPLGKATMGGAMTLDAAASVAAAVEAVELDATWFPEPAPLPA